jgi:acetylornithine/succinyldiaminopimelate/putrescine aminotransferase
MPSSTEDIIELEGRYVLQTYARPGFVLERGEGCWVYDTEGRAYLDCVAGIAVNALGHADPGLAAVLAQQAASLWHVSNLYHTAPQARLAQKLCESSFADRVFFCNSGAEAIEGAFKFAQWAGDHFAPKHVIVAFTGAFHGRTFPALAALPECQAPFRPLMPVHCAVQRPAARRVMVMTPVRSSSAGAGEGGIHRPARFRQGCAPGEGGTMRPDRR